MRTVKRTYIFSGADEVETFVDILSVGPHGSMELVQANMVIPFVLKGVDDVDQIITALNMLRNDMVQAGAI